MVSLCTFRFQLVFIITFLLFGCSSNESIRYQNLDSSAQLVTNDGENSDHIPYIYKNTVDWKKYNSVIIHPIIIYSGKDHQFGDMAESDKQLLASYMKDAFIGSLNHRFTQVQLATENTLKVQLTLTGAESTSPVLGTLTKVDLGGGIYNIVQSIRGKEGLFNGSIRYVVEIYDGTTNRLLYAYVAKQYPNAMNISASIGSLSAAKVGIDKGAEELAEIFND